MVKNIIIAFIVAVFLSIWFLAVTLSSSFADEPIQCPLQRQPDVYYPTGLHQIYGEATQREGEDSVYHLEGGNALQCFCAPSGEGVQTTWTITTDDLPGAVNGKDWGLSDYSYVAVNTPYVCNTTPTLTSIPTMTVSPTETLQPTEVVPEATIILPTETPTPTIEVHEMEFEGSVVWIFPGENIEKRGAQK